MWQRILVFFMCLSPMVTYASTWYVEQDGSGDFTTIQPAVDVSAPGDTVRIGPGEFLEPPVSEEYSKIFATIDTEDLTIIGSGAATIIGPLERDWDGTEKEVWGLVFSDNVSSGARLEKLAIRNLDWGVCAWEQIMLDRCSFSNCRTGTGFRNSDGSMVRNCNFEQSGMVTNLNMADNFVMEDCNAIDCGYLWVTNAENIVIRRCSFHDGIRWPRIYLDYSSGLIDDCSVVEGRINIGFECEVEMSNCDLVGMLFVDYGSRVTGTDNRLQGTIHPAISMFVDATVVFTNSHILKGDTYSVVTNGGSDPRTIDLSGNYLGTDSPDSIDAWIYDSNDFEHVNWEILYEPFSFVPLPTQRQTQGGIRQMFR